MGLGNSQDIKAGGAYIDIRAQYAAMLSKDFAAIQSAFSNLGAKLQGIGAGLTLAMAGPVAGIWKSIEAGSMREETVNKFGAVFKELTAANQAWAKSFAPTVKMAETEVMGLMALFQDTFVPLGFARIEAAQMSQQLVMLSKDLASFNPTVNSAGEAAELLTSALVGNHEAVRRFGVIITENSLNAELLRQGIAGGTQAATEQQKVMARLNMLMSSTSDAQGDAARTAGSWKNSMMGLKSALQSLGETIGAAILPAMRERLYAMVDILNGIRDYIQQNEWAAKAVTAVVLALATAGPALVAVGTAMRVLAPLLNPVVLAFGGLAWWLGRNVELSDAMKERLDALKKSFLGMQVGGKAVADWLADLSAIFDLFVAKAEYAGLAVSKALVQGVGPEFVGAIGEVVEFMVRAFLTGADSIEKRFDDLRTKIEIWFLETFKGGAFVLDLAHPFSGKGEDARQRIDVRIKELEDRLRIPGRDLYGSGKNLTTADTIRDMFDKDAIVGAIEGKQAGLNDRIAAASDKLKAAGETIAQAVSAMPAPGAAAAQPMQVPVEGGVVGLFGYRRIAEHMLGGAQNTAREALSESRKHTNLLEQIARNVGAAGVYA
jgi:hypothetical protein